MKAGRGPEGTAIRPTTYGNIGKRHDRSRCPHVYTRPGHMAWGCCLDRCFVIRRQSARHVIGDDADADNEHHEGEKPNYRYRLTAPRFPPLGE